VYENTSELSLEAYLSKVFARTQHRCHEPISCKILDSKASRNFPNSDMMWGSAEQRDAPPCPDHFTPWKEPVPTVQKPG
jgi:hypothetical protein